MKTRSQKEHNPFDIIDLQSDDAQKQVIDLIVRAFAGKSQQSKRQKAWKILSALLACCDFNLKAFCKRFRLSESEIDLFLTHVLYAIYYERFLISSIPSSRSREFLEVYFLTVLAENLPEEKMEKVLFSLTPNEKLRLTSYSAFNLHEGAWITLNVLERIHQKNKAWLLFFQGVRRKYYDPILLDKLLRRTKAINFKAIVRALEEKATSEIQEISTLLPELIELIVTSPVRGLNALLKLNKELNPTQSQPNDKSAREDAEEAQEKLNKSVDKFRNQINSVKQLKEFFRIFGLRGQLIDVPLLKNNNGSLLEILKKTHDVLQVPHLIPLPYFDALFNLASNICQELYAYFREPSQYALGLDRIAYALSTRGRHFSRYPWLSSVLSGLNEVVHHLHKKGLKEIQLRQYPIIIFDQAHPKEFAQNEAYIRKLAKKHHASIWHISRKQIIELAEKLNVRPWIETSNEWFLGHEGSRNCIFFLAPVLHRAIKEGMRTFDQVLKHTESFEDVVMGKRHRDAILHLGEDDLPIPVGNIFADALFAANHQEVYFRRFTHFNGRVSWSLNRFLSFESVAAEPSKIFASNHWTDNGGVRGTLTKPRFCFPSNFPNEEWHVIHTRFYYDFFQQPLTHLAGARFPQKLLPTAPTDGLAEFLDAYIPYNLEMIFAGSFIDPTNVSNRSIFPWNDASKQGQFECLADVLKCASESIPELKSRFWRNMESFFENGSDVILMKEIQNLLSPDFSIKAPANLKNVYRKYQLEATIFMAFGKLVTTYYKTKAQDFLQKAKQDIENHFDINLDKTHFAKALYRLVNAVETFGVSVCMPQGKN